MDSTPQSTAQQYLKFDRVAFHIFALSGQGSEAIAAFSPRSCQTWLERHEAVQPWIERSAALASLWRRALTRPESISAAVLASAPGACLVEYQAGRLGNPSFDGGALVWHVAVLGLSPESPFDAVDAAQGLVKILAPLMGACALVEVPALGRMLQRAKPGMAGNVPTLRVVRKLPDFAGALHSAFEAVILSDGPLAPQGPASSRL